MMTALSRRQSIAEEPISSILRQAFFEITDNKNEPPKFNLIANKLEIIGKSKTCTILTIVLIKNLFR